jgi:hypothetical protein
MATDLSDLSGSIRVSASAIATKVGDLSTANENLAYSSITSLVFGSATTLVDQIFTDTRTIATSTTDSIDLVGGLTNKFGVTINFAKIKAVIVVNKSTDATCILTIGNSTAVLWRGAAAHTETLVIGATSYHANLTGWAVVGGASDILDIVNASATAVASYDIIVIGTSA